MGGGASDVAQEGGGWPSAHTIGSSHLTQTAQRAGCGGVASMMWTLWFISGPETELGNFKKRRTVCEQIRISSSAS